MDFQFSEEHLMIQKTVRDFARNECLPGVILRDEQQKFPKSQIEKLAILGFMGMMVRPEYGGMGLDTVSYVVAMEEISKIDSSMASSFRATKPVSSTFVHIAFTARSLLVQCFNTKSLNEE